jgi:hypothetical protein
MRLHLIKRRVLSLKNLQYLLKVEKKNYLKGVKKINKLMKKKNNN